MADQDRELLERAVAVLVTFRRGLAAESELGRQCDELVDQLVLEHSARYGMGIDGPMLMARPRR